MGGVVEEEQRGERGALVCVAGEGGGGWGGHFTMHCPVIERRGRR